MFLRTIIKVLSKFLKRSLNISIFEIQLTKRQNPDRSGGKIEEMDMQTNLEFDFWSGKWEFLDQNFLNIRINVFSVRNPISLVSLGYLFDFASIHEISTPGNFIFWTVFGSYQKMKFDKRLEKYCQKMLEDTNLRFRPRKKI